MKKRSILKRFISIQAIAATMTLGTLIPAQGVYANGGEPIRCNGWQYDTAVANSGNSIKNFNGYDRWDSMVEILNRDGRAERFWLDGVPGQKYGRIRTTYATTACTGFAWWPHQDFGGGLAKEMVVARLNDGRLIVVHIGTDDAIYWRTQRSFSSYWTGWQRKAGTFKNLQAVSAVDVGYRTSDGILFTAHQFKTLPDLGPSWVFVTNILR